MAMKTLTSLDFVLPDDNQYNLIIIPSGSWLDEGATTRYDDKANSDYYGSFTPQEYYNPFVDPNRTYLQNEEREESTNVKTLVHPFNYQNIETKVVLQEHVTEYAQQIFNLAVEKSHKPADCVIGCLRGGLELVVSFRLVNALPEPVSYLKYTQWNSESRKDAIAEDLKQIVEKNNFSKELYTIAILDTSIGGYGAENLAKLIQQLKPDNDQSWVVYFYLLNQGTQSIRRLNNLYKLGHDKLKFIPIHRVVSKLIREDWDEALGYKILNDKKDLVLTELPRADSLLLVDGKVHKYVESQDIRTYLDTIVAKELSLAVETDPRLNFTGKEVWPLFTRKV